MKKYKKYRVSLALKIQANFEVKVNAKTRKEALEIALEKYCCSKNYDENNFTEPDWANHELDIKEEGKIDDLDSGIFIEEIK